jgi:hypothetical protein
MPEQPEIYHWQLKQPFRLRASDADSSAWFPRSYNQCKRHIQVTATLVTTYLRARSKSNQEGKREKFFTYRIPAVVIVYRSGFLRT